MTLKDFKKITKEKEPEQIIGLYTSWKIKLTDKQLDKVLKLKKEKYGMKRSEING